MPTVSKDLLARSFQQNMAAIAPAAVSFVATAFERVQSHPHYDKIMAASFGGDDDNYEYADPFRPYDVQNGVVVIPVSGVLAADLDFTIAGTITGYPYIQATYRRALADPAVNGVVLLVNSCGGDVNQCFELVDEMYAGKDQMPITTVVQGMAASAAYALASLGDTISISNTSEVGSIGVVGTHVDMSAALADQGLKITKIYAGSNKINGDSAFPLSSEAYAEESALVTEAYNVFVNTVARNRPVLTTQDIINTQAGMFSATQAIANRLADSVSDVNSIILNFSNQLTGGVALAHSAKTVGNTQAALPTASALPVASAAVPENQVPAVTAPAASAPVDAVSAARAEGMKAATERFSAILGCDEANANPKLAFHFASKTDMTPEAAMEALRVASPAPVATPAPAVQTPVAAATVAPERADNQTLDTLSAAMAASAAKPQLATQLDPSLQQVKPVSAMTASDLIAAAKLMKKDA